MEQCLREGIPFPDKIAKAPDLLSGLEFFFIAFLDLLNDRPIGMGVGPISWKTVHDYCRAYEIVGEQKEEMHFHITQMDSAYIEFKNRKK